STMTHRPGTGAPWTISRQSADRSESYPAWEAWPIGMNLSGAPRTPIVKGYSLYRTRPGVLMWAKELGMHRGSGSFLPRGGRFHRLEVFEQSGEGRLERVVMLPVREVGDEILPDLHAHVLPDVRVETLPIADGLEVHQADRKELATALLDLSLPRLA